MLHQSFKGELSNKWVILRTSPARTVALERSLRGAKLDAYTPKEVIFRRRPRSNHTDEIDVSITPTFVFLRASQVDVALDCLAPGRINPHPPFSLFLYSGRAPLVADTEIEGFKAAEIAQIEVARLRRAKLEKERRSLEDKRRIAVRRRQRRAGRQAPKKIDVGSRVRIQDGAWAGMTGVVMSTDGRSARVDMGGWMKVNIETWLLVDNRVRAD